MTQKSIGTKDFEISDDLKDIAKEVILEHSIDLDGARVEYLLIYPNISKKVAGRCIKTNKELQFFSDADYIIQMSGELWDVLPLEVKRILMLHELKHILPFNNEKKGIVEYRLVDHDIQDFNYIIQKYGLDWFHVIKECVSSIYDMDPADLDKIYL